MPKIMVINVTHSEESRVGILKDGVLEAFEIEALSREHLKGNIYKGVVRRIHPALEAAFVDIGAERDAFLPLDEICFRNLPRQPSPANGDARRRRRVRDLLRAGEEVLVQIVKEQFGNKPPTLTTFYSLPGRYLVLLPGSDDAGISRRIEGDERTRIRKLIEELAPPEGFGIIIRTAAGFDQDTGELARDLTYLQRLWENVKGAAEARRAPVLVYREHDLVLRTIRDYFAPDIDEIHIDNEEVFQRAGDFLHSVMPGNEGVLRLFTKEQPIFTAFGIENQIESIFKRRVPLRSGGTIVIDTTEALTAIDVNSGGSVRGPNPEETAFRTNVEACREITRQLRLRDIGGIIVVDFIDMRDAEHVHEIERSMREAMRLDKARHEIGRISRLGLMEISRQRLRPAAMATTYTSCPMCEGHGAIRTTESAALVALRKLHNRVALGDVSVARVALPNDVALYLLNQKRDDLAQLEERYNSTIQVVLDNKLMPHQMELEARARPENEQALAKVAPGAVVEAVPAAAATNGQAKAKDASGRPAANGEPGSGKRKRRRRGGRRGRGRRAAAAIGEALAALGGGPAASDTSESPAAQSDEGERAAAPADLAPVGDGAAAAAPAGSGQPAAAGAPRRRRRSRGGRGRKRSGAARPATAAQEPVSHPGVRPASDARPPLDAHPVGADVSRHAEIASSAPARKTPAAGGRRRGGSGRGGKAEATPAAGTKATARNSTRKKPADGTSTSPVRKTRSGSRRRKSAAPSDTPTASE